MKRIPILAQIVLCLSALTILPSCEGISKKSIEGTITYDVSFPYVRNKVLLNVFPEEMTVTFKDDQAHSVLQSLGGIVSTEFIANEKERTFSQYLKAFQDRYSMELNEKDVLRYIESMPSMRLEPTGEKDSVAGFLCDKTIAHFNIDSVPPVILYHTKEIGLENPNWYTQYKDVDGVLLGYELEQCGMRMKLLAKDVQLNPVPASHFTIQQEYTKISTERMEQVIDSLMQSFGANDFFGGN